MKTYVSGLLAQMDGALAQIELSQETNLRKAEQSYHAVQEYLRQLKTFIQDYSFADQAEEIYFFKEMKPLFACKLFYFIKLFEIESNRYTGSIKVQRRYLRKNEDILISYFKKHKTFYKYYRSGATYLDNQYFLRGKFNLHVGFDAPYYDCDPNFCTSHDYKVAKLLAQEMLAKYIDNALAQLEPNHHMVSKLKELDLGWADTKAAFIELIYGLEGMNSLYNKKDRSKPDIKKVATFFELVFEIDLGNYYRTFQELRIRKKGRTSYLDKMKEALIRRMDDSDENYSYP